jgi:hypothetical protein
LVGERRGRALWILGIASLVILGVLMVFEGRMKATGGPGIVPFEVAGSQERAREILALWGPEGRSAARASLIIDYPFLLAYASFYALACTAVSEALARRGFGWLGSVGMRLAWGALAAGAFDAVENAALLGVLATDGSGALAATARWFAIGKFTLTTLVILYVLGGLVLCLVRRRPVAAG